MNGSRSLGKMLAGAVIAYQWSLGPLVGALFGTSCRFSPSCSNYAVAALREHGAWRGFWLAARRLIRCRPGGGHGYDPVPSCQDQQCHGRTFQNPSTKAA